jgi:ankyrin repeat protein
MELAQQLWEEGEAVDTPDLSGDTPLHRAAVWYGFAFGE